MEIQISYGTGAWAVDKKLRLSLGPDEDEKLAKSVVNTVNRFLKQRDKLLQDDPSEERDTSKGVSPAVEEGMRTSKISPPTSEPIEPTIFEPAGCKGMLRLTCPACNDTFFHFAPQKVSEVKCRCGRNIPLDDTAPAKFYCGSCEREYKLKTNSVEADITSNCGTCGQLMTARWNAKRFRYEPHGSE